VEPLLCIVNALQNRRNMTAVNRKNSVTEAKYGVLLRA
jgi:hypothetical protein